MNQVIKRIHYSNGNIKRECCYINGNRHKDNGPAIIDYYENGNILFEQYYINGNRHKDNGPAIISYYYNGNILTRQYYINGNRHRDNGPAYIEYFQNGNIEFEPYWTNNKLHIENGPAIIEYKEYYLNGYNVTKIYYEVKEILEKLSIPYSNEYDLEMIFKLSYNDLYYQIFNLIRKENEND